MVIACNLSPPQVRPVLRLAHATLHAAQAAWRWLGGLLGQHAAAAAPAQRPPSAADLDEGFERSFVGALFQPARSLGFVFLALYTLNQLKQVFAGKNIFFFLTIEGRGGGSCPIAGMRRRVSCRCSWLSISRSRTHNATRSYFAVAAQSISAARGAELMAAAARVAYIAWGAAAVNHVKSRYVRDFVVAVAKLRSGSTEAKCAPARGQSLRLREGGRARDAGSRSRAGGLLKTARPLPPPSSPSPPSSFLLGSCSLWWTRPTRSPQA